MAMTLPTNLLCDRRPEVLNHDVDFAFLQASDWGVQRSWGSKGLRRDYRFRVIKPNSVRRWLRTSEGREIERGHIVDAGALIGRTLGLIKKRSGFEFATGISAVDPGYTDKRVDKFLFGDLQNREVYEDLEPADLILSEWTLSHMADPLSAIELLANHLKTGGHMVFDTAAVRHELLPPVDMLQTVFEHAGLEVVNVATARTGIHRDGSMHLKRLTSEPVLLDVSYGTR